MIRILFFASLREHLGIDECTVPARPGLTVAALRAELAARGDAWTCLATGANLRAAVNQDMAQPEDLVSDGAEVAFFPPVTGG